MSMYRMQPGWLKMMNLTRHKKVSTKAQYDYCKLSWRMEPDRLGLTYKTITIGHGAAAKFSNGWVQTLYFVLSYDMQL